MNTEKRIPDAYDDLGTGKKPKTQRKAAKNRAIAPAGKIYFLPTNWLAAAPAGSTPDTSIQTASAASKPPPRTTPTERKNFRHLSLIFSPAVSLCIIQDSFRRQGFHCRTQSRPIVKTLKLSGKKRQTGLRLSPDRRNLPCENIVLNAGYVSIEDSQAGTACNEIVCACRIVSGILISFPHPRTLNLSFSFNEQRTAVPAIKPLHTGLVARKNYTSKYKDFLNNII